MRMTDAVGAHGERVAARVLRDQGLLILATNWRCAHGELDIVARDPGTDEIVFVEVKTRRSTAFGHPAEAVTAAKLARLRRLAGAWSSRHPTPSAGMRLDVVAVELPPGDRARVRHLRGVG